MLSTLPAIPASLYILSVVKIEVEKGSVKRKGKGKLLRLKFNIFKAAIRWFSFPVKCDIGNTI